MCYNALLQRGTIDRKFVQDLIDTIEGGKVSMSLPCPPHWNMYQGHRGCILSFLAENKFQQDIGCILCFLLQKQRNLPDTCNNKMCQNVLQQIQGYTAYKDNHHQSPQCREDNCNNESPFLKIDLVGTPGRIGFPILWQMCQQDRGCILCFLWNQKMCVVDTCKLFLQRLVERIQGLLLYSNLGLHRTPIQRGISGNIETPPEKMYQNGSPRSYHSSYTDQEYRAGSLEVGRLEAGRLEAGRLEVGRLEVGRLEAHWQHSLCKRHFRNPSIYQHHRCEIPYYQTRQWGLFFG